MRSDLTAAFIAAKDVAGRQPRQLMVFKFPVAGNVYVSDQTIVLGGQTYLPLVENWGELTDAASAESDFTAEVRQMSVTLLNGGENPFSNYFLKEDPENVEVLIYQWFVGLADADKALIDRLVIQDPISFDEASRLLTLDLVSINMRYVGQCGAVVTTALWPKALPEHVGKAIPLIFGDAGECGSLCVKTAPQATLRGSIVTSSLTIECNESLGVAGFPSAGYLQIEDEKIQYFNRTDSLFYVQVRGSAGTERESHPDNAEVHQLITDHTYILGAMPISDITGVKVDGQPAPAGSYSVAMGAANGGVVFNEKPYSNKFAASAQSFELPGWLTSSVNSAWQPQYAYDANKTSSSAMINGVYQTLALELTTDMFFDMGLVVAAYLKVHHWATNVYVNDYCEVWIDGIGVVGRLSNPSPDDVFQFEAEVDIDHPHDFNDPAQDINDPTHPHNMAATVGMAQNGTPADFSHGISSNGAYGAVRTTEVWFNGLATNVNSSMITLNVSTICVGGTARIDFIEIQTEWGGTTLLDNFADGIGANGAINISGGGWPITGSSESYWVRIRTGLYVNNADITVIYQTPVISYAANSPITDNARANTGLYTVSPGETIPLLTNNRDILILSKKSPPRTLIDIFDLSDHITPSWSWFVGRRVEIRYKVVSSADAVNVFIPWLTFEVEFRKRERVYSNNVTATVVGDLAKRPDQVLQTLLAKAALPAGYIDSASFATAGTWYANRGYTIDGVIDGGLSVQEAVRNVCRQTRSRLFWGGGQAKLAVRKTAAEQGIVKQLSTGNYQLKSISAQRQRVADLVNFIKLFYKIDRVSSGQPYQASVFQQDSASIAAHGQRERPDEFRFDLVRSATMATSLASYFISTMASPSTFYEFNGYLPQFEIEKEDVITLTSAGFHKMRKMPMAVRSVNRIFGSGKNKTINHLHIIAECLRYILVEVEVADSVLLLDSINATIGRLIDLADQVHTQDELTAVHTSPVEEAAVISEVLEAIWAISQGTADSVTPSIELSARMAMPLADMVKTLDYAAAWRGVSFGSQDFGTHGFGGIRAWGESNPDELLVVDYLGVACNGGIAEMCMVADRLAGSNGFGSAGAVADGFGSIPMGK